MFPDPRLAAAIVAAIVAESPFNAPILETGTFSYRLRTETTGRRRGRPAAER